MPKRELKKLKDQIETYNLFHCINVMLPWRVGQIQLAGSQKASLPLARAEWLIQPSVEKRSLCHCVSFLCTQKSYPGVKDWCVIWLDCSTASTLTAFVKEKIYLAFALIGIIVFNTVTPKSHFWKFCPEFCSRPYLTVIDRFIS